MLVLSIWITTAYATQYSHDPGTGLETWQVEADGIQVRLTQIGSEQAQAFYQARGFSVDNAKYYASSCVFMTVVRNIGDATIEHRLSDWRYVPDGGRPRSIRSKREWGKIWIQRKVPESARIAFTWAQFPNTQSFSPSDWNQGMTTYQLPPGARFNLIFKWREDGKLRRGEIDNVRCTDESH